MTTRRPLGTGPTPTTPDPAAGYRPLPVEMAEPGEHERQEHERQEHERQEHERGARRRLGTGPGQPGSSLSTARAAARPDLR